MRTTPPRTHHRGERTDADHHDRASTCGATHHRGRPRPRCRTKTTPHHARTGRPPPQGRPCLFSRTPRTHRGEVDASTHHAQGVDLATKLETYIGTSHHGTRTPPPRPPSNSSSISGLPIMGRPHMGHPQGRTTGARTTHHARTYGPRFEYVARYAYGAHRRSGRRTDGEGAPWGIGGEGAGTPLRARCAQVFRRKKAENRF